MSLSRLLVIGGTGLVGRAVLQHAAARHVVEEIVALVRRDPGPRHSTKISYRVVDFNQLDAVADAFAVDAVISTLGTTARQTPDPAAYRRIEVDLPLEVATRAHAAGATRHALVSSIGASPDAGSIYLRQKAELERGIEALGWARSIVARPSVLLGQRDRLRPMERIGAAIGRLAPLRYRSIDADTVAAALVAALLRGGPAIEVLDNVTLHEGIR
ncbi:MAG TPA: NAD(P)H-binding protein [Gemmatimonadales bacterium]|nr:NAD(P)H-binding protein [Gemmatimonadales bacterium]